MSFLRAITPTIRKEITVKTPDGEQSFVAVWKRPNDDQRIALLSAINASADEINSAKTSADQATAVKAHVQASRNRIKANLHGWEFKDGELEVEFNTANLDEMLQWTEYRNPLDMSLISVLNLNPEETKAGNSLPVVATSPAPTTVTA